MDATPPNEPIKRGTNVAYELWQIDRSLTWITLLLIFIMLGTCAPHH